MKKIMLPMLIITIAMMSSMSVFAGGAFENALVDLRTAHWLIDTHPKDAKTAPDETLAKNAITGAMGGIKKAGIDDGKDLKEHPVEVEKITDRKARLAKAAELLQKVRAEITKVAETEPAKKNLKNQSLALLNEAIKYTEKLIGGSK